MSNSKIRKAVAARAARKLRGAQTFVVSIEIEVEAASVGEAARKARQLAKADGRLNLLVSGQDRRGHFIYTEVRR